MKKKIINNNNNNNIFDEYDLRKLPLRTRLDKITQILKNEKRDDSIRWDAVWLAGEILEEVIIMNKNKKDKNKEEEEEKDNPIFAEIADLYAWVLRNDNNPVVKHEAAFQIGLLNMKSKIPDLLESILNDKENELVKHEAIEALGLMRAYECKEILEPMTQNPNIAIRETTKLVLKRLDRLLTGNKGDYRGMKIIK